MESPERDKFVQNSYILMIGYLLSSIISSIGTIFVIRLIPVEDYALLTIAYIIPEILIVFGDLGLNYASTHFIARKIVKHDLKGVNDVIKINLIIKIFIGLLFALLIIIFSNVIAKDIYKINDNRLTILVQLASIGIISSILYDAMNSIFLGALKVKMVRIGTILRTSIRTALSIILILIGLTILGPMLSFVLSTLIVVIIYFFNLKKLFFKEVTVKEPINWNEFSEMVKYGYPLFFYYIIAILQVESFIFILTIYGFINEISYFNVAIISGSLIGILTKSISYTLFPIFSKREWDNFNDREKLTKTFQFSLKFCSLIVLPVTILLILFAEDIFPIIFGENYRKASSFISIFFLTFLFACFGSLSVPAFFNGQKNTKYVFYIELIKYVVSIVISLVLIPFYGGIGVIHGIVIGTFISVIYGNIIIRKYYGIELFKNIRNIIIIFLAAFLCGILTYLVDELFEAFFQSDLLFYVILRLGIAFSFYILIFLFLIGILSQITNEELNFFIRSFESFPLINKIVLMVCTIEKKILFLGKKQLDVDNQNKNVLIE